MEVMLHESRQVSNASRPAKDSYGQENGCGCELQSEFNKAALVVGCSEKDSILLSVGGWC